MSQPHLKLSPEERSVRRMARKLSGQVELDHIMSTVRPGMQNAVFEQIKPWILQPVKVTTGSQLGDETIVTQGLEAGASVLVKEGVLFQ